MNGMVMSYQGEDFRDGYLINRRTLCLLPFKDLETGRNYTKVVEEFKDVIIRKLPLDIIKESCDFHGVDYYPMRQRLSEALDAKRKLPFVVLDRCQLTFFPTGAIKNVRTCHYLSCLHMEKVEINEVDKGCIVFFKNGRTLKLLISAQSCKEMQIQGFAASGVMGT